jgi:hypothetical protein
MLLSSILKRLRSNKQYIPRLYTPRSKRAGGEQKSFGMLTERCNVRSNDGQIPSNDCKKGLREEGESSLPASFVKTDFER